MHSMESGVTRSAQRPDLGEIWELAYKSAVTTPPSAQAEFLLDTVGPRIAAACLGLSDARQIKAWARDATGPREHAVLGRLTLLFRIVFAIANTYGAEVAALFLRSSNPQLDDEVPMLVLRDSDGDTQQGRLLAATRAFLEG